VIEIEAVEILPSSLPPPTSASEARDLFAMSNYAACRLSVSCHALDREGAPAAYRLAADYWALSQAFSRGALA
jgi:hypothetical protein